MSERAPCDQGWIPAAEYDLIQAKVPILCVDLLPLDRCTRKVGLIRRETYDGGEGWCMIGGAVRRKECLAAALKRHVLSTLGKQVDFDLLSSEPLEIAEYLPDADPSGPHDPRKHAVALTYAGHLVGEPHTRDEAIEFRWFDRAELGEVAFGFGQGVVVRAVLGKLG